MEDYELYKNLTILLNMFRNRPYHLAKFLIENNAISSEFTKKLINSDKLKELSNTDNPLLPNYFYDIKQMEDFYNSFIDDFKQLSNGKGIEEITKELNSKLENFIILEKFEEAAKLRDYMNRNKIKRIL